MGPETTMKGTGFKDAKTAYRTIEIVKQKQRNRQVWTINAMYYRAKHHPKQTESMREAMKIFKVWLDQYKEEKEKENEKKKIVTYKNTTNVSSTPVNSMIHKKKNQIQSKRKHNTDGNNFDDCEDDKMKKS